MDMLRATFLVVTENEKNGVGKQNEYPVCRIKHILNLNSHLIIFFELSYSNFLGSEGVSFHMVALFCWPVLEVARTK